LEELISTASSTRCGNERDNVSRETSVITESCLESLDFAD
jgi:hypothetical protein